MISVLCFFTIINEVASVTVRALRAKPSVAVMFVGRTVNHREAARESTTNLIDSMTGAEEDADSEGWQRLSASGAWDSTVKYLIRPIKRTHEVDIYVCVDTAGGLAPPEVKKVFVISATDQEARGARCVSRLKSPLYNPINTTYDWLIKVRPDFIFFNTFPIMTSFKPGYVYTRFRSVQGIGGLTSAHVSWDYCVHSCTGMPSSAVGYVNDDMIRVVPGDLIDFTFHHEWGLEQYASPDKTTKKNFPLLNWVDIPGHWNEGKLTRFWAQHKIFTLPLACMGYPRYDPHGYGHSSEIARCIHSPVKKACGGNVNIELAHRAINQSHQEALSMA